MSDISADYAAFRKMTEDLAKLYEKLSCEVANIGRYTADLDIFWDGAVNDAYNSKLGRDIVTMGAIVMKIREAIISADAVFGLYMDNEKNVGSIVTMYGKEKVHISLKK